MASRAISLKSSFADVVISPPTTTRFDLAYVSHATRLRGSWARHASRTASEIVSHTLSGWPSPTDSEEKIKFLLMKRDCCDRDLKCHIDVSGWDDITNISSVKWFLGKSLASRKEHV